MANTEKRFKLNDFSLSIKHQQKRQALQRYQQQKINTNKKDVEHNALQLETPETVRAQRNRFFPVLHLRWERERERVCESEMR